MQHSHVAAHVASEDGALFKISLQAVILSEAPDFFFLITAAY